MPKSVEELLEKPLFRIEYANLYYIQTKNRVNGRDESKWEAFKPFEHQKRLNRKIFKEKKRRILVPKARRMGFSTLINIAQFDFCLYNDNWHSKIVDQSQADATDKLVNRVQKAWQHMETQWKDIPLKCVGRNQSEVKWSNGSLFTADTSGRGGSAVHFLHVSELGPIDFEDAKRADEIIDGAFPAADGGIIVVESTAKGPTGHFKRLCDNALAVPEEDRTVDDWEVMFFAWHDDPRHERVGKYSRISKQNNEYLDYVESRIGRKLSDAQRLWYHITSETTSRVKYEYPSLLEECWEQPIEGAIYADAINRLRSEGKIGNFGLAGSLPVYTIWDLGGPSNTRCVFFQIIQGEIRIIDAQMGGNNKVGDELFTGPQTPTDWARLLSEKGYHYAAHILPHDGNIKQYHGQSFQGDLARAGVTGIKRLQRRKDATWERITETLQEIGRFAFNSSNRNVDIMIKHLEMYHTKMETDGVSVKAMPHHDFSSHFADAFGSIIEAVNAGKCVDTEDVRKTRRRQRLKKKKYVWSAYA